MEKENNLDQFLAGKLSSDEMKMTSPTPSLVAEARKKIELRKRNLGDREDLFSMIASFLNLKIKLYHAVIATIVIGGAIVYFSKSGSPEKNEVNTDQYVSNIAAVRNSTVLSSIHTFILSK